MNDAFPHTVTFQTYTKVSDDGGGYEKKWVDVITIEAFVDPLSGTQLYQAMQQKNPVNMRLYYPFQEGITSDMRVIWMDRDEILEIQSKPIDQGGQGEIYRIECLLP